ncbi:hypothetical protein DMI65_00170 [Escherichia coli]|nr:hypothetical protein [Escherichia coli]
MGAHEIETIPLFVTVLKTFWRTGLWQPICVHQQARCWLGCIAGRTTVVDRIYPHRSWLRTH